MEENNNKKRMAHKIEEGNNYKIRRTDRNGFTFYNINVSHKAFDGQIIWGKKQVRFKSGIEIADGTTIKILKMTENLYKDKNNKDVFYYMILEFENLDKAIEEYEAANPFDDDPPF